MPQDVTLSLTTDFAERSPEEGREKYVAKDVLVANDRELLDAIAEQLSAKIGQSRFDTWFDDGSCFRLSDQNNATVVVAADSSFNSQRIQSTFGREIRMVVDRVCGPQFEIEFKVVQPHADATDNDDADTAEPQVVQTLFSFAETDAPAQPAKARQRTSARQRTDAGVAHVARVPAAKVTRKRVRKSLDQFYFGQNNPLVATAVEQSFRKPGQYSPLFVYGATGSGKSHLLEAVAADYRRRLKKTRCVYLSAEQFTGQFLHSLRGGSGLPMFRKKYRDLDLLAIDDVQFFAGKRATLSEFQYTVDQLIRDGKQVMVAADRPPLELTDFGGELITRLNAGLVCSLDYPDIDGRRRIAKNLCEQLHVQLDDEVIEMVCQSISRDARKLAGAINRLSVLASVTAGSVSVDQARQTLTDLVTLAGSSSSSMPNIEKAVCDLFDIKPTELKSSSRRKRISSARMLAMYLSRQYTSSAFSEIGDYYGGRTHSTVIAAEKKMVKLLDQNQAIALPHAKYPAREVIKRIESSLRLG